VIGRDKFSALELNGLTVKFQVALRLAKSGLIPVLSRNCKGRKI
jgi:hypothetical protein